VICLISGPENHGSYSSAFHLLLGLRKVGRGERTYVQGPSVLCATEHAQTSPLALSANKKSAPEAILTTFLPSSIVLSVRFACQFVHSLSFSSFRVTNSSSTTNSGLSGIFSSSLTTDPFTFPHLSSLVDCSSLEEVVVGLVNGPFNSSSGVRAERYSSEKGNQRYMSPEEVRQAE
jgi:hypothetical protein